MKNPALAAILSGIFSGLGQFYNGQAIKGIIMIVLQGVNLMLMLLFVGIFTFIGVWIWGIVDAYKTALRINQSFTGGAGPQPQGGLAPR